MKTLKELFDKSENRRYLEALMEFDRGDLPACNAKVSEMIDSNLFALFSVQ